MRLRGALTLVLVAATLAVFAPLFRAGFVDLDDAAYVWRNPHVQEGFTSQALRWAWTSSYAANWHPLTWMSHMLDWRLFGKHAAGHHAVNLLLHAVNAVLLLLLLWRTTGAVIRSALVAALFALHPQHVESVAWVAERKDVLSTVFWLLATLAYVRRAAPAPGKPAARGMLPVALLLAAGLCAKPMLVTLPFTLLLLDVWPLRRLSFEKLSWPALRPLLWEKIPLLVLVALSSGVTYWAQASGHATTALELGPATRVGNAVESCATYLVKTVWPSNLAIFYPHPLFELSAAAVAGAGLLLAAASLFAWRLRRTHPYLLVGWLWYLGTLVPVIGLVQVGGQARADRYTYVPLIGIFIALVWGTAELMGRVVRRSPRGVVPAADSLALTWPIFAALPLLGFAAHVQARTWHDPITLWSHAIEAVGPNPEFEAKLANALTEAGRGEEAIVWFERSLAVQEKNAEAHNNLSRTLAGIGRSGLALEHALRAVELDAKLPEARVIAGALLLAAGRTAEAEAQLREACRLAPDSPDALNNLGAALLAADRPAEALEPFERAQRLDPLDAKPVHNRGRALARLQRPAEALAQFEQAVRLAPGYVEALNSLGGALVLAGRPDEAILRLKTALTLRPDYAHAHANLAAAYYLARRDAEAWAEIVLARRHGLEPPAELIAGLKARGFQ